MTAAFLDISEFQAEFGALSSGQTATAERLLRVVSDRVRELKPDPETFAAKQVVFEVVRDAINFGALEKLSSFQNVSSRRQESGAFDDAAKVVDDYLTPRHRRLLGVASHPRPSYTFGD